jgi:hypothetical protein
LKSNKRIFIVYYDFPNTSGNHTGMAYLAKQLKKKTGRVVLYKTPRTINKWHNRLQKLWRDWTVFKINSSFKRGDSVLFMEYLTNASGWQTEIAINIREKKIPINLFGIVHLSGSNLLEVYNDETYIKKSVEVLDKTIVFGSSLKEYFDNLGFSKKVITTFHYVDTGFYKTTHLKEKNQKLQVICIGNIKRNFESLKTIIANTPSVEYHVCMGKSNLEPFFNNLLNVRLHGFLPEQELLKLMQQCDVSLSVMFDTIGSNVITTSFACALVNVVSDVGSIRDYCSEEDSIICKTELAFINSLNNIDKFSNEFACLKNRSLEKSQTFCLDNSIKVITKLINN